MVDDLVTSKQSKGLTIVDQINSHNANVFIGKLGDILSKQLTNHWEWPSTGDVYGLCGLFTLRLHVVVWSLAQHQVQDMMWNDLAL